MKHLGKRLRIAPVFFGPEVGRAAHPVEIRPGAEMRPTPTQDDDAHRLIHAQGGEGLAQPSDQRLIESVVHRRPIEPHGRHTVFMPHDCEHISH